MLRCKEIRSRRFQVKHRLATGAEELFCGRQQIRSPRADCHHNAIGRDALFVVEDNSVNSVITFIQMGETAAAAQFDADGRCALD